MRSFNNSVGGHKINLMLNENDLIIKSTNDFELDFYSSVNQSHPIFSHIPKFYGTLQLTNDNVTSSDNNDDSYIDDISIPKKAIVIENFCDYFSIPNILDLKLGKVLHDEFANEEKANKMKLASLNTTSNETGIRFTGFKVWNTNRNDYDIIDKAYGKSLKPENLPEGLSKFLSINSLPLNYLNIILKNLIHDLEILRDDILKMPFKAIGTSLLIIYEADIENFHEDDCVIVKLIDFAHTRLISNKDEIPDHNILFGINYFLELLYNFKIQ